MKEKGKVMVVDDDESLRMLFTKVLQMDGWVTIEARNGKEAMEKVSQEEVDLMILDNRMPELSGKEVYKKLREQGIVLPVILITAASEIKCIADELGILCYLPKPVSPSSLRNMARRAITGECSSA